MGNALQLPSNFLPKISATMLLPPQPYLFWNAAANLSARVAEGVRAGALQGIANAAGSGYPVPGYEMTQFDLNDGAVMESFLNRGEMFMVPDDPQFANARAPQTILVPRLNFATPSGLTESARRTTRATISTTAIAPPGEDMVQMTIHEYSGPYSAANSAVQPFQLTKFDLERGEHSLAGYVLSQLGNDRLKYFDAVVRNKVFAGVSSANVLYSGDPNGLITTDAAAFPSSSPRGFYVADLEHAERNAAEAGIMPFSNGRYMFAGSPQQIQMLKGDLRSMNGGAQFLPELNPLKNAYVGTIGMTDVFVAPTNPTGTVSGVTYQRGIFMGRHALAYKAVKPCEVITDPGQTNFGRFLLLLWQSEESVEVVDGTKLIEIRSN